MFILPITGLFSVSMQAGGETDCSKEIHLTDFKRDKLGDTDCYPWFQPAYEAYKPGEEQVAKLHKLRRNISVVAVGGSWCSDTHELLPKFYKTVEQAEINPKKIQLIGVDRDKKTAGGQTAYGVTAVPTFILFYKGKEIGRITETIAVGIEDELLKYYSPFLPR